MTPPTPAAVRLAEHLVKHIFRFAVGPSSERAYINTVAHHIDETLGLPEIIMSLELVESRTRESATRRVAGAILARLTGDSDGE